MILTRGEIIRLIKKREIRVEPFDEKSIGPASIDLRLGNEFRIFDKIKRYDIKDSADADKITKIVHVKEYIDLKPGQLILGVTKEKITLPENVCGWIQGRSRFARLGLMVYVTAAFMQPGINNHQVLEIFNASNMTLRLYPGTKVCQFVFEMCKGKAKYEGRYRSQVKP